MLGEVRRLRLGLELDGLEHEVGRVDLTVRMRIAHTDDFALILEY